MFKSISSVLLLLCLVSCAGQYNRRMTLMMDPFIGKPITQVTEAWGPPTTVYDEAPFKVFVWHSNRTYGGGSYTTHAPVVSGATGKWETRSTVHTAPVRTSNTYRMYWVASDGTCSKYKFGVQ